LWYSTDFKTLKTIGIQDRLFKWLDF